KSDEARIRLKIRGSRRRVQEVEAVIDTGFTSSLTLPSAVIADLGLRWQSTDRFAVADGNECLLDVYVAKVEWGDRVRSVLVTEVENEPLVGMRMLRGHELNIAVRSRGKVTIKPLGKKV